MKRRTKIICTLGPASRGPETVQALIQAGMDCARLNFSHGRAGDHRDTAGIVREAARRAGREVRILQDLQGPKWRIAELPHPLHLRTGDTAALVTAALRAGEIPVADPEILRWIRPADRIFLDDGALELEALSLQPERILCAVRIGGRVDSRSGLRVPGRAPDLPALSPKDLADLETGREAGVDAVAQSMVRSRADVDLLKKQLGDDVPIVAKIENAEALRALEEIARGVWGLMVARGDLGVSIPRAQVPLYQKEILALCRRDARFGIVATEMLLSMVKRDRPTRAEVSDVATAVLDGADALMLSEETAIGDHPVAVVNEMREIIETVEGSRWYAPPEGARPPF